MLVSNFIIVTIGSLFILFLYLGCLDFALGVILARSKYACARRLLLRWEFLSFFYFGLRGTVVVLTFMSFDLFFFLAWNQMSLSDFVKYVATVLTCVNYCSLHQKILHLTTSYTNSIPSYFDFFLLHHILRWGKMLWTIVILLHALFFYVLAWGTIYTFVTSAWTWFYLRLLCLFFFDELDFWIVAKRLAKKWEDWAATI